jgi:hypothetical protein
LARDRQTTAAGSGAPSLLSPHNRKRRTRAPAQIPIKSAVEEMISISSIAPQLFLLHCNEYFASKNLKVDTCLFYDLLSRVSREPFSGERIVVHPHNSCMSDILVTTKGRLCLMQSSVISQKPCSSQSRAARK